MFPYSFYFLLLSKTCSLPFVRLALYVLYLKDGLSTFEARSVSNCLVLSLGADHERRGLFCFSSQAGEGGGGTHKVLLLADYLDYELESPTFLCNFDVIAWVLLGTSSERFVS